MSRSYQERRDRADAVRAKVFGDVEAPGDDRLGAAGAWWVDHVLGEVWSRDATLPERDRALVAMVASAALGHATTTGRYARAALATGVTPEELDAVLGHVFAYAGEGAVAVAGAAVAEVCTEVGLRWPVAGLPAEKDDDRRRQDGYDVMRTIGGGRVPPGPEEGLDWFRTNLRGLGPLVYEWAFGEVWCHGPLSRRDRSLVVIAIIAALGVEAELRTHARGGLHHGLSREEAEEVVLSVAPQIGLPRTVRALRVLWDLWAALDEQAPPT